MPRIHMFLFTLIASLSFFTATWAQGDKVIASSGQSKVGLLELYSSESCSSCPPADRWVSSLENHKDLWSRFVPVVFHVDYWNHLNWKDEFSSGEMTARQMALSQTWAQPAVYTPSIILNSKEWRNWRDTNIEDRLTKDASELSLQILQNKEGNFWVKVTGAKAGVKYVVHLVKLGVGLTSKITDGENSGKTLQHGFIVLDWQHQQLDSSGQTRVTNLKSTKYTAKRYGVAAWIEQANKPIALQSTGAFL